MNIFIAILLPCVDVKKILLEVLKESSKKLFSSQKIRNFYEYCKNPPKSAENNFF